MRLLHVVHTLNPDRGGPSESVRMFVRAHQRAGNDVEVATLDGPADGPAGDAYQSSITCPVNPCGPGKSNYGFSPRLDAWLAAKGANAPVDTPLTMPATTSSAPVPGNEDIPVEDASALPPPASSTDGGTP